MSSIPIPSKGDIVTIENKQYRVLKVTGTIVEVLAMYNASTSQKFNATSKTVKFTSGYTGQQYKGSDLDTYLNETFFATLSVTLRAAIVPKNINQDMWKYSSSVPNSETYYRQTFGSDTRYYFDSDKSFGYYGTSEVGTRNVYALSIRDVIDYLGVVANGDFADTDIWQMFWNRSINIEEYPYLRSADRNNFNYAFYVSGYNGYLDSSYSDFTRFACPTFQIDWDILYPSAPTLTFKHFYDAGTIGSGTVKFRHYSQTEPLSQLATPQNVAASGTTVSWDAVENATSYAVLADGSEIGTVEKETGYTVTFTCQKGLVYFNYSIDNESLDLRINPGETKNIIVTKYLFIGAIGMTPEVVSYSGGILETGWGFGKWKFTPTQNNSTITVVDND